LDRVAAQRLIRRRAAESEAIFILPHARQQMRQRRIDFLQVQRCLRTGSLTEGPYVATNSRTGAERCNVEASISGDQICVVVEIAADPELHVITVFKVG